MNLFVLTLLLACSQSEPEHAPFFEQIQQRRSKKDISFKTSKHSPLPPSVQESFEGLLYYPIDPAYVYTLQIHRYQDEPVFEILTSTGEQRQAHKYGYFDFLMSGKPCRLQVYKLLDLQQELADYLFVPFTDATSGQDSYPGGRYLDLKENDDGIYDLDFNLAYNPSCAYGNSTYSCPIPPAENRLEVAIRAGEKRFPIVSD